MYCWEDFISTPHDDYYIRPILYIYMYGWMRSNRRLLSELHINVYMYICITGERERESRREVMERLNHSKLSSFWLFHLLSCLYQPYPSMLSVHLFRSAQELLSNPQEFTIPQFFIYFSIISSPVIILSFKTLIRFMLLCVSLLGSIYHKSWGGYIYKYTEFWV